MPDSRRAVISFGPPSDTHGLWIADTESDALDRLLIGPTDEDAPSVAPDGKRLAFTANLENYDVVAIPFDGSPIRDLAATSRSECCAAWVPGTATFVYVTNSGGSPEIRIHDPGDRSDRVVASTRDFRRNAASAQLDMGAVSPDGERVAFLEYSSSGFAIWITPIAGGAPVRLTRSADPQESGPSWSPDGEWISFLAKDGGIPMLMRSRVGSADAPQVILRGGRDESKTWCCVPEWSPTGEWIAFVSDKGIKLVTPDGTRQRLLSSMTPHALAWSHDGARLYVLAVGTDRRTAVESIDLMSGSATTIRTFNPDVVFTTPQNPGVRASLAADGRSLLTTALRTRSDIWMLEGFDRPRGMLDRFRPSWSQ
jgi:Tol biopolymer transport system component